MGNGPDTLEWKVLRSPAPNPHSRASYELRVPYLRLLAQDGRVDAYSGDAEVVFTLEETGTVESPSYRFSIDLMPESIIEEKPCSATYSTASGTVEGMTSQTRTLFAGYAERLSVPGLPKHVSDAMPAFIAAIGKEAARYEREGGKRRKK